MRPAGIMAQIITPRAAAGRKGEENAQPGLAVAG